MKQIQAFENINGPGKIGFYKPWSTLLIIDFTCKRSSKRPCQQTRRPGRASAELLTILCSGKLVSPPSEIRLPPRYVQPRIHPHTSLPINGSIKKNTKDKKPIREYNRIK